MTDELKPKMPRVKLEMHVLSNTPEKCFLRNHSVQAGGVNFQAKEGKA
jgi:hypothetical protein